MGVFALLHSVAAALGGVHQFAGQTLAHGVLVAPAGGSRQPADGQGLTALGAHFDRHLVGGTANAARAHFHRRGNRFQGVAEDLERVFLRTLLDQVERNRFDVFSQRASLSTRRKVGLLGKSCGRALLPGALL